MTVLIIEKSKCTESLIKDIEDNFNLIYEFMLDYNLYMVIENNITTQKQFDIMKRISEDAYELKKVF